MTNLRWSRGPLTRASTFFARLGAPKFMDSRNFTHSRMTLLYSGAKFLLKKSTAFGLSCIGLSRCSLSLRAESWYSVDQYW